MRCWVLIFQIRMSNRWFFHSGNFVICSKIKIIHESTKSNHSFRAFVIKIFVSDLFGVRYKEHKFNDRLYKTHINRTVMGGYVYCRTRGFRRCGSVFSSLFQILYRLDFPGSIYIQDRGEAPVAGKAANDSRFPSGHDRCIFIQCLLF